MECPLFHTTAFLNGYDQVIALIDNGSQGYATMNEKLALKLGLPLVETTPRKIGGSLDNGFETIRYATYFSMDIGGLKNDRIWAYVVPKQSEALILGRPWLQQQGATIDERQSSLSFDTNDVIIRSNQALLKCPTPIKVTKVSASTYVGHVKRSKKPGSQIQTFAASLQDIEKALRPKAKMTMTEILEKLPSEYQEFAKVFDPAEAAKLPQHRPGMDHEIPLERDDNGKAKEVPWGPLYSMSKDELLVLRKELTSLLDKQFIQESKSPAAAPILFAKKPGGGLRFCVDYRGLNAITRKDRYPLPLIRETLVALSKAKWLTKLDVTAAFHRVRMAKGEEWKTAFRTRYGLFEWKVCPFGLTGAPATFQRYINCALREYLDEFCSAYVDDILIFSSGSLSDHREKVKKVLRRLDDNGLQLDLSKCEFETRSTKYLGHIIEVGVGIRMDPDKVKAIVDWKAPTTVKGVRSFLGFANYYRMFIKDYSNLSKPLTDLTKKDMPFQWAKECQTAFDTLKERFSSEPVLANYDSERPTRLEPDASGWACGGVLTQFDDSIQSWRPVAFFSTKHLPAECNYDIHDKELLAIVKCVKEWSSELRGLKEPFTVLTDHKNLEPFTTKKVLNERQVRWSELLSQFQFTLRHRAGKEATIPDVLSRREQDVPKDGDDSRLAERQKTILPQGLWVKTTNLSLTCPFSEDQELRHLWNEAIEHEETGTAYARAREAVQQCERTFPKDLNLHFAIGECDIHKDFLRYRERLWLPSHEPLTTRVIQKVHDSSLGGHPGRDATIALLSRQFFWPGQNQDVRRFLRNCDVCGRTTIWRDKKKGLLKPLPIPSRVWQEISMDFVTDLPPAKDSGATTLLVITDRFSKGTMLLPIRRGEWDAENVAWLFFERYVPIHWIPKSIVSDRGTQFVNAFWARICQLMKIERRLSTAFHPETDGSTERRNQEVETYLRVFVTYNQTDWARLLPLAQISIDNKPAAATGVSPFFMFHGYDATPIEISEKLSDRETSANPRERAEAVLVKLKDAQEFAQYSMVVAQQSQEHYANKHRETPASFQTGDKVWLNLKNISTDKLCKKLDWIHAKYTVTRTFRNSPHFYELDVPKGIHKKFHVSLLRPAATDSLPSQQQDDTQPPAVRTPDGDDEHGVESILCCRTKRVGRGRRREALVKWTGYADPTWIPLDDLEETMALDQFEEKYGDAKLHDGPIEDYVSRRSRG